jgi:cytokinin dehydrogenase
MPESNRAVTNAIDALASALSGRFDVAAPTLDAHSRDFGGLVERRPIGIVRARDLDDVRTAFRAASEHGVPILLRGTAHSQSGQCLAEGAIAVDLRGLSGMRVDSERQTIEAMGGTTWRAVVDAANAVGSMPRGLTLVVDATVGGTLSVGGVGSESYRFGAQVNNVEYLDVMTLDGVVTRCSPSENRELFDCVRSGLGQVGAIIRMGYPLRPCKPLLRTYSYLYHSAENFIRDVESLHRAPRGELLLGFVTATRQGPAGHALLLTLGSEHEGDGTLDDGAMAEGLAFDEELPVVDRPVWNETGIPGHIFYRMHTGMPWDESATRGLAHPWVDHLFAPAQAIAMLEELLEHAPAPLAMGTCGIIPVARAGTAAPLFRQPRDNELSIGVGMFPNVPRFVRDEAAAIMRDYSRRGCERGGIRYLSGYVDLTGAADWAGHYGETWEWFQSMKRKYDPMGLLDPGFLIWE